MSKGSWTGVLKTVSSKGDVALAQPLGPESTAAEYIRALSAAHPRLATFKAVKKRLENFDGEWLAEFLRKEGLGLIVTGLQVAFKNKSIESILIQIECIACLKAYMNNQEGLEALLAIEGESNHVINALAGSLLSESVMLRAHVLALLAAISAYSDRGHSLVLKSFDNLQKVHDTKYRFNHLVFLLRESPDFLDRANAMTLVNSLISSPEELKVKADLRAEFLSLGLFDVLRNTKEELVKLDEDSEYSDIMAKQIEIFFEEMTSDHQDWLTQYPIFLVDLHDPNELFLSIRNRYAHPDLYPTFLAVFQAILSLPIDSKAGTSKQIALLDYLQKLAADETQFFDPALEQRNIEHRTLVNAYKIKLQGLLRTLEEQKSAINSLEASLSAGAGSAKAPAPEAPAAPATPQEEKKEAPPAEPAPSAPPPPPAPAPPPPAPPAPGGAPPPPPPGGKKGAPPPPPMGGAKKAPAALPAVVTKKELKTRKIAVTKVDNNKLKDSVWSKIKIEDSSFKFDPKSIEDMFQEVKKAPTDEAKPKKATVVSLLPGNRSNNIGVILSRFKLSFPDIKMAIVNFDLSQIELENAVALKSTIPTSDEYSSIKDYYNESNQDISLLGKAERYILEVGCIPRLGARLDIFILMHQFASRLDEIREDIALINKASTELLSNDKLARVLEYCLALVLYLNAGSGPAANIAGFKFSSLLKFGDTKSTKDTSTSLLHVAAQMLEKEGVLDFMKGLPHIDSASKVNLPSLLQRLQKLKSDVNAIKTELDQEHDENDPIVSAVTPFYESSLSKVTELEAEHNEMTNTFAQVAKYCGENPADAIPEELFAVLPRFSSELDRALQDIKRKRLRDERAEKAKQDREAKEKEAAEKKEKANAHAHKAVVDEMLDSLQHTNRFRARRAEQSSRSSRAPAPAAPKVDSQFVDSLVESIKSSRPSRSKIETVTN